MSLKGIPVTPPKWLSLPENEKDVRKLYRDMAKKLNEIGKVRDIHAHTISLGNYVINWWHYHKLEKEIRKVGEVVTSDNGNLYMNPTRTAQITRENAMQKELVNLGLTVKQLAEISPRAVKPDAKDAKDAANFMTG